MKPRLAASAAALVLAAGAVVFIAGQGCSKIGGAQKVSKASLKTDKDKVSYVVGYTIGTNFRQGASADQIDPDLVSAGMRAGLANEKSVFSESEVTDVMRRFQQSAMARQEQKNKEDGEKNKKEGDKYLADNKAKPGVTTLPSGLQYKVVTPGDGPSPKPTDVVTVNYRGTLIDGTEFDSSYKRNEPATFPVNGVIKGWQEALPLMKKGAKWQLTVPAELAYGPQGQPPKIGPNAVLLFEVELVSIGAPTSSQGMPGKALPPGHPSTH